MIERCLWTPNAQPLRPAAGSLSERVDVAIVGGGYTGLAAARVLARHGADVVVLERHTIGWGASGRNAGFVLPGYQADVESLARRYGLAVARRLFQISLQAVEQLENLVAAEPIDCDYSRCGALTLAAKPSHFRRLEQSHRFLRDQLSYHTALLRPGELAGEIGSSRYHGALLDPGSGALHPGRYCLGLAAAAEGAGAQLLEGAEVHGIRREAGRFDLTTARGPLSATEVLVATNGYTGPAFGRLQRGVVPIGSYLIATAPLDPSLSERLLPRGRVASDTRHLLSYFRLSPDRRMMFGGRASFTPTSTRRSAEILTAGMCRVFPELAGRAGRVRLGRKGRVHDGSPASRGAGGRNPLRARLLRPWSGAFLVAGRADGRCVGGTHTGSRSRRPARSLSPIPRHPLVSSAGRRLLPRA
ncbi:MAG: FAD-binding oxidoreductase [Gemmatimonadales bacterium]|nr:FAD-binding oxidoreductase [Gemmatimonadales bacterium]